MKTQEELGEDLCKYCPLPEGSNAVRCYGGAPVSCEGSHCNEAYESYKEECTEFCINCDAQIHPDEAEYVQKAADDEYGPLCSKCAELAK